jgi:hypothetical protein
MKAFNPAKVAQMIQLSDSLYTELSEMQDKEINRYYGMLSDFKGSKELQKLKKEHNKLSDKIYLIAQSTDQQSWDNMVKEYKLCPDSWSYAGFEF